MTFWIRKLNWPKIFLCSILYTVVTMVVHIIEAMFTMSYFQMPQYMEVWSPLMRLTGGTHSNSFYITSLVLSFITGISLCLVYCYLQEMLPKKPWKRVAFFGDLMIGTSFIFFTLPSYLLFNVPSVLLISWFISGFVTLVITSYILVKILN